MGRKNSQAGRRPLDYTEAQLKSKDARARARLKEVFEPYDRPKAFSNPLSEYVSQEALEELKSTYWKE
jgi:hypothetical protein